MSNFNSRNRKGGIIVQKVGSENPGSEESMLTELNLKDFGLSNLTSENPGSLQNKGEMKLISKEGTFNDLPSVSPQTGKDNHIH